MNVLGSKSNNTVQSNSVTSQFNSLNRDIEKFRSSRRTVEVNLNKTQSHLQQLRKEQASLQEKIQSDHESLGTLNRKRLLLTNEKNRLSKVAEQERKSLEACARHTKMLFKQANDATIKYITEMGEANDEVADLLRRQMNKRIVALLSVESVQSVLVPKFPKTDAQRSKAFSEALDLMQKGKQEIERQQSRNKVLCGYSRKESHSAPDAVIVNTGECTLQQMELFYGSDDMSLP